MKKLFREKLKNPKLKKLAFLSLFFFIEMIGFSQNSSSQEIRISLKLENVSLGEILQEIKKQSHKNILYNNKKVDLYKNQSLELKNNTLEEALDKCLKGKNLKYRIVDDVIIIEPIQEEKTIEVNGENQFRINSIIKGRVIEKNTEMPIVGATILINDSTSPGVKGTTSDVDGYFRLATNSSSRISLQVSFIGYIPVKIDNILLKSGKELILNIELEESVIELKEVAVVLRKDKPINDMATVSARAFTIEETERFAGSFGDPSRMATNYAGIFTVGDQRNDIIIRGNSPTGLLWQLEDVPIPSPNHFSVFGTTGGPISMLNNNLLSRSDFFTSAFPAEYGNASSGVFDLKMRNGNYEKNEYLFQLGMNGFEGGAEGPISRKNKSSYIVNGRYSMLGLMQDFLWVEGLPQYEDLSFKVNFPLKSGKISAFGLGGTSAISITEDDNPRTGTNNEFLIKNVNNSKTGMCGVNYLHNFNSATLIKVAIAATGHTTNEDVDSTINGDPYLKLDNNSYNEHEFVLTSKLTRKINLKNTASFGVIVQDMSFESQRMTSDYDSHTAVLTIDKPYSTASKNMVLSQAYLEWKHSFTDFLNLNCGINAEYFQYNKTSAIDPRFGISWQFTNNQSIGFGYGLHSQIQPLNVYFIQSKVGFDENGRQVYADLGTNKNLDFTRSNQFVLSHNYSFNQNLRLKTEAYFQYLFNVPVKASKGYFSMINAGAAMSVPEEDSLINAGYGKNYGLELTLEKFLSQHYYFLVTTSLFNSLYQGADKKWRNTTYNGNYILNLLGGYEIELANNIILNTNLRTIFAGGRRLIPFDLEKSIQKNGTYYLYDQAYEKQAKSYFRMDIRIGVMFQRKRVTHELALDIANLTNHKNVYRERFNEVTGKPKISYQQGIYPMGLYRLNF